MSISFSDEGFAPSLTSSAILPEDAGEGSLRPRTLADYVGHITWIILVFGILH